MAIVIDNFSIDVDEWVLVSDLTSFSVDVTDTVYPISVSGTYFLHDGNIVPTILSGISNGYKAYYYPASVISSGTIVLTIHAENTNSGIIEQNYNLLYGYHVTFDEVIDWGPKSTVVTTVEASNSVFCPNVEGAAVYFETRDLESYDLDASITAITSVDLSASIYPQNKFFFYDRTYTITVSGIKDFNGNELEPVVFSFTIENPK